MGNSFITSGEIDYTNYGKGGTTRIVGIYIDPLVTSGDVVQFSDHIVNIDFKMI